MDYKMKLRHSAVWLVLSLCCVLLPGAAVAGFAEGLAAFDKADYAAALQEFDPLAAKGAASAQYQLGIMYDYGLGVPQDYNEAVKLFHLAADQGYTSAQLILGMTYASGLGVPLDYKEAVKWYRLAADKGNALAQSDLGAMYANGLGVSSSRVVAYALFSLSTANGSSNEISGAAARLTALAASMSRKEIRVAQDLTRELAKPGRFLKALDRYVKKPAIK